MGKLTQLLAHDVLPKFPQDPEALFLCASADFLTRKFDAALRAMQRSLLATPEGHCTARELAAREPFFIPLGMGQGSFVHPARFSSETAPARGG
jgi:hypothetical protein